MFADIRNLSRFLLVQRNFCARRVLNAATTPNLGLLAFDSIRANVSPLTCDRFAKFFGPRRGEAVWLTRADHQFDIF